MITSWNGDMAINAAAMDQCHDRAALCNKKKFIFGNEQNISHGSVILASSVELLRLA